MAHAARGSSQDAMCRPVREREAIKSLRPSAKAHRSVDMAHSAAFEPDRQGTPRLDSAHRAELDPRRSKFVRELFEAHYERVFCFLSRRVSAERAEDLAQEVFFRLLKHRSLETVEVSRSYLFKIAENLVKNSVRRDSRRRELACQLRELIRARDQGNSGGLKSVVIDHGSMDQALAVLTANERSAITLIVCRGLSYEAASIALGVSVTTINNWKHRGIKKLRERTESEAAEGPHARESIPGEDSGVSKNPHRGHGIEAARPGEARSTPKGGQGARLRLGCAG